MLKNNIKPQILISTLWVFILFSMIIRDLHDFLRVGAIEKMMSMNIAEEMMLFYGFIAEMPILMILLSRILNNKANKWANIIISGITFLGIASTVPSGDMDDVFFAIVESIAIVVIVITAWRLPPFNRGIVGKESEI